MKALPLAFGVLATFASPNSSLARKVQMTSNISQPPIAAKHPDSSTHHGVTIVDPYAWLRDPSYPKVDKVEVLDYLKAENAYFEAQMKPYGALVDTIFEEMKGRLKEDESSVPQRDGAYLYWRRFEKGAQYKQWMRKLATGGPEELILDEAMLAKDREFFRLGGVAISEDDRIMAYSSDTDGSERFTVRFRDLTTGSDIPDTIPGTLGGVVFSKDGTSLLYGLVNENWRIDTINLHRLGTPNSKDKVIYFEPDHGFQAGVGMTQDRNWIVVATGDNETSEIRLLPADEPLADPILVRARKNGVEYDVETHDDMLFIHTNDTSTQFRLVTAPLSKPSEWTERIAASPNFYMTGVSIFAGFFVVEGRDNGLDQVEIHKYSGGPPKRIKFPEASYSAGLDENPEYNVTTLRLSYESMVTPDTVAEYDLATGEMKTLKVQEIPSGYDASQYTTERVEITVRRNKSPRFNRLQ